VGRLSAAVIIAFTAASGMPRPAAAQTAPSNATSSEELLKQAKGAYDRKDYAAAMAFYRKLADHGDAQAQFEIGWMYQKGLGVPEDYAQARAWYEKSAQQGDERAMWNIGWLYEHGTDQNLAQALHWYEKAAERGRADLQFRLGRKYLNAKDCKVGMAWVFKAANQGYPEAQTLLSGIYEGFIDCGVRDLAAARTWMERAAKQGFGLAEAGLGRMYVQGAGGQTDFVAALNWLKKGSADLEQFASDHDYDVLRAEPLRIIGMIYERGAGVPKDAAQAIHFYQRAAALGDADAKERLAKLQASPPNAGSITLRCKDPREMRLVSVDPATRTVTVQGGFTLVYREDADHYVRVTDREIEFGCRKVVSMGNVLGTGLSVLLTNKKNDSGATMKCLARNRIDLKTGTWIAAGLEMTDVSECTLTR
jgi:hypothetical protein